jgi:nucleoside-diphosphate-sugar epimerase
LETLLAAADAEVRTFLYLGSIAAYGTSAVTEPILNEGSTPDRPANIYEISKSAAEKAVLRVGPLIGVNTVSLRLGDIFGRWEHKTGSRQVTSAIHQVTAHAATGRRSQLQRPGRKAWTYSKDVGSAVAKLIACDNFGFDTINLSSPFTWSVEDWCRKLAQKFSGYSYEVSTGHSTNVTMYADNAPMAQGRLERQTGGWRPEYGLNEAFDDYLSWLSHSGRWTLQSVESPASIR